jgi:hypothetical protein
MLQQYSLFVINAFSFFGALLDCELVDNVCECSRVRDEHIICEWVCVCVCVCSHSESLALIFAVFLLYYSFCSLVVMVA